MNNTHTRRIPALVVTCALAMLAVAAIPSDAHAYSYYSSAIDPYAYAPSSSYTTSTYNPYMFPGHQYGYGNYYAPNKHNRQYGYNTYQYPVYYYYPVVTPYPVQQRPQAKRPEPDYFFRDYYNAQREWDQEMNFYRNQGL